jgi:Fe-S-cluster containining protein
MLRDPRLRILDQEIDLRARSILEQQPAWPCRRGCDHCCRHLAAIPQVNRLEWESLQLALETLDAATQEAIRARLRMLVHASHPFVCPFLDTDSGNCLVYVYRPIACRTYGFYVDRDKGLYCPTIEAQVDAGQLEHVVWGNAESIDQRLHAGGEPRDLLSWFLE